MEYLLIIAIVWSAFGLPAYGLTLGYFQGEYPELRVPSDVTFAAFIGLLGPVGLLATAASLTLFGGWHHGLQFVPKEPTSAW